LRGDTADLLGQIGHPSAREALKSLLKDPNPDVAEIAKEALEALRDGPSQP
jgi:HEAT repeat protein